MLVRISHTRLLRAAGLFTWAMVGLPLLYLWLAPHLAGGGDDLALRPMPWQGWLAYLAFGACYAWLTRGLGGRRHRLPDYLLLVVLTLAALGVSYYNGSGLGSVLLMVAACVLPWLLPLPWGVAWLLAGQLAVAPVFIRWLGFPPLEALMQSMLYAGFSGFVFIVSLVALQQAQAREEQRRLNAELRATRALLADSARVNERTRIARELHDLLGHHLTALSLNLEVAGHLSEGRVKEHVQQAHTLARLLLTDVREAVSQLREGGAIDLGAALRPLAENVPSLQIHMDIQAPLTVDDPERAHVLLRCAQEAITNAVRHSGAGQLWLSARREGSDVVLRVRDDGRGSDQVVPGNGLRGLGERLRMHGGRADIASQRGHGFQITITLPVAPNAALSLPAGAVA
ncbi:sensor histidine kinase [Thermomonas haemolytica]|uniref:Signal transduction histidine kinase n=1 Tax=Thermomonas haemolytica TaxID=141949 RepID=A0A4R3NBQ8_9GAMM|nr:sensor histidine kinase [Thermomonas haemolytica]TCT26141.1 signal transduction histidine kinase [Thermomonas haemolytica]TNY29320.1 two-component sensor histidine kinase [Thermomonas haemolytica]